ncbi:hypothetical protein PVK06_021728 [Gossypium arboreum]|uniref:Uncharacterized protein n=1 Tax=Gossypium arboreum TaxID=29729 RepID=A0ABR0PR78_GOSAR|nr:hypothetical protein PVK06_021728 [Gossypium arboreum]
MRMPMESIIQIPALILISVKHAYGVCNSIGVFYLLCLLMPVFILLLGSDLLWSDILMSRSRVLVVVADLSD